MVVGAVAISGMRRGGEEARAGHCGKGSSVMRFEGVSRIDWKVRWSDGIARCRRWCRCRGGVFR